MRKLFSLIAAVLFAGSMMAAEATLQYTGSTTTNMAGDGANNAEIVGLDANVFTVICDKGANQNNIGLNKAGDIRLYADKDGGNGNKLIVNIVSGEILSIVLDIKQAATFVVKAGEDVVEAVEGAYAINAASFSIQNTTTNATTQLQLNKITINYEAGEAPAVATPVIEGKEYFIGSTTVTMSCSTENSDIYYTVDGTTDPKCDCSAAPEYENPITLTETTTIMAAAYTGNDWSAVATKTFTKVEEATCAQAAALAADEITGLNEVVVTYVNGGNIFIKDESGSLLIFANGFDLKAGDVVKGFIGKSSPYKGLPELVPAPGFTKEDINVEAGEAPEPEELTAAPTAADVNKYVVLKGVSFKAAQFDNKNITAVLGEEEFAVYNKFNADAAFDTEKKYDLVGVGSIYNTTLQLYFISATEQEVPVVEKDYYLVGNMTEWKPNADYKLALNEYAEGEEYWGEFTFAANDEFKVAYSADGQHIYDADWFPTGMNNNYKITEDGTYQVYFRPNYDGGEGWYENVLFVLMQEKPIVENDTIYPEFDYAEVTYLADYKAWQINLYAENEDYVPDFYIGVYAKSEEMKIAGTYTNEEEEIAFVEIYTSLNDSAVAVESSDFVVTFLEEDVYHYEFTFVGDDDKVYIIDAELRTMAFDEEGGEIELVDGEEEGVEETEAAVKAIKVIKNGQIIIEKNGVKYNVLGTIIR